jgi:hypothetical protein
MFLPLAAIAFTFFGIWILAVAVEFWIRSIGRAKSAVLPKSGISLVSLLLFLFAPTKFTHLSNSLRFDAEPEHGENR